MKKIIKRIYFPLSSVLFSIAFVLIQFNAGISELYIRSLFWPTIGVAIFALLIFGIIKLLLKDRAKSEIFSSLLLTSFFLYGAVVSLNWNFYASVGNLTLGKNHLFYLIWIIFCVVVFLLIRKTKNNLLGLKKFLVRMSLLLMIIPVFLITSYEFKRSANPPAKSPLALPKVSSKNIDKNNLPDIYFILPEDDSSASIFKNYFAYDESDFVSFLKDSGFFVADEATSNYPKTFESLASMLNMEYLDYLSVYKNSSDMTIVNPLINNNNVMKFLKKFGYKYYQLGSWWDPTKFNPSANKNFTLENNGRLSLDPFFYNLVDSTMLGPLLDRIAPRVVIDYSDDSDRQRILYQFAELPKVENLPGPKFVFAHILAPHGPYVFDKDCNYTSEDQISTKPEVVNYTSQDSCINKKLKDLIKTIISNSKKPPVIVLVTDEGAPFLGKEIPNGDDDWKDASIALLEEKFPILAAYYLPGVSTQSLYSSITPVNSFREIFNLYFNAGFQILPDKNFIFQDLNNLYQFTDVTTTIK